METRNDRSEIVLDSPLQRARGVIGRYPEPDERYRFEYDEVAQRSVHMIGVRRPLQVTFLIDGKVTGEAVLRPWTGVAKAPADTIVEERPAE